MNDWKSQYHKRNIVNILIIAVVSAVCVLTIFFVIRANRTQDNGPRYLGVPVLTEEEQTKRTKGLTQTQPDPSLIEFNGSTVPCDTASSTFYISQNKDTQAWEGTLESTTSRSTLYFTDEDLLKDKAGTISAGTKIPFLQITGNTWAQGYIVVSSLPIVSLDFTNPDDEIKLKEDHEGTFTLIDPERLGGSEDDTDSTAGTEEAAGTGNTDDTGIEADSAERREQTYTRDEYEKTGTLTDNCLFHQRGNSSTYFEKKSYKVSLKNAQGEKKNENLLGMRNDDDWILNPIYADVTKVREKVAYRLWDKITSMEENPMKSSEVEYVELILNGEYQGLYGLMYPVDKKTLSLDNSDILYKINTWNYPSEAEFNLYADRLYILDSSRISMMEVKYPKSTEAPFSWDPMRLFQNYVYGSETMNDLEAEYLTLNMDSEMDYSLFCMLVHGMDNTWKNTFLVAKKTEDGYELFRDIWDLNYTFGDCFYYDLNVLFTVFDDDTAESMEVKDDYPYEYERLLKDDSQGTHKLAAEKWKKWRDSGISGEYVQSLAQKYLDELKESGALEREEARWPEEGELGDLTKFNEWVTKRFGFLDQYFGYETGTSQLNIEWDTSQQSTESETS